MRLVYDYSCFRSFLKDYYVWQKTRRPTFSYGVFARQLGLSSPAHIQLILAGKRNLTVHTIHRLAEALPLPPAELEFFEALVHENQAEGENERRFYRQRLKLLRRDKPLSSARLKLSTLLSTGFLPALLLSIEGKDLETAKLAAARFGQTPEDAERILAQLLKEGVAVLKEDRISLSHRHLILHDEKARSQAQKRFLAEQLKLSRKAFERMYEAEAKFFSHTFTINEKRLDLFTEEIKRLLEKMTKLSDEEPGETVMQLNLQLFPYEKTLNRENSP